MGRFSSVHLRRDSYGCEQAFRRVLCTAQISESFTETYRGTDDGQFPCLICSVLPVAPMMAAAAGTCIRNRLTGSVTVSAAVVVSAVVMTVMSVTPRLRTAFYRTYRAAGVTCYAAGLSVMTVSVGSGRKCHKSCCQYSRRSSGSNLSAPHSKSPP